MVFKRPADFATNLSVNVTELYQPNQRRCASGARSNGVRGVRNTTVYACKRPLIPIPI